MKIYFIGHTLNRLAEYDRPCFNKPATCRIRLKHMKVCQRFIIARGLAEVTKQPGFISPTLATSSASFSKLNDFFFGYFDPEKIVLDNENKDFSG